MPAKKKKKVKQYTGSLDWAKRVDERIVELQGMVATVDNAHMEKISSIATELNRKMGQLADAHNEVNGRLRDTQYKLEKMLKKDDEPRPAEKCPLCNMLVCVSTETGGQVGGTPHIGEDVRRRGERRYNQHKVNVSRVIEGKRYFGMINCPMSGQLVQEWGRKAVKES